MHKYYHNAIGLHIALQPPGSYTRETPAVLRCFLPPFQSLHTDFKDLLPSSFSFHAIMSQSTAFFPLQAKSHYWLNILFLLHDDNHTLCTVSHNICCEHKYCMMYEEQVGNASHTCLKHSLFRDEQYCAKVLSPSFVLYVLLPMSLFKVGLIPIV